MCNDEVVLCNVSLPCSIRRYSVIPLSQNSGLIGWVPHSDTLHTLIRDYRERKKIMLNVEHRLMLQVGVGQGKMEIEWCGLGGTRDGRGVVCCVRLCDCSTSSLFIPLPLPLPLPSPPPHLQMSADYDRLSLLQKVEVFEHALESTRGDDLAKVLWLKSPNSEVDGRH